MTLPTASASLETLQRLPVPARPRDVMVVPDGYEVEVLLVGLSMPTGMDSADDGTLYLLEGGTTWPPRPYVPARIPSLDTAERLLERSPIEDQEEADNGGGSPTSILRSVYP